MQKVKLIHNRQVENWWSITHYKHSLGHHPTLPTHNVALLREEKQGAARVGEVLEQ
jgi:hypothetical protein